MKTGRIDLIEIFDHASVSMALRFGYIDVAEFIMTKYKYEPSMILESAIKHRHLGLIHRMLQEGARISLSMIFSAGESGDITIVKKVLSLVDHDDKYRMCLVGAITMRRLNVYHYIKSIHPEEVSKFLENFRISDIHQIRASTIRFLISEGCNVRFIITEMNIDSETDTIWLVQNRGHEMNTTLLNRIIRFACEKLNYDMFATALCYFFKHVNGTLHFKAAEGTMLNAIINTKSRRFFDCVMAYIDQISSISLYGAVILAITEEVPIWMLKPLFQALLRQGLDKNIYKTIFQCAMGIDNVAAIDIILELCDSKILKICCHMAFLYGSHELFMKFFRPEYDNFGDLTVIVDCSKRYKDIVLCPNKIATVLKCSNYPLAQVVKYILRFCDEKKQKPEECVPWLKENVSFALLIEIVKNAFLLDIGPELILTSELVNSEILKLALLEIKADEKIFHLAKENITTMFMTLLHVPCVAELYESMIIDYGPHYILGKVVDEFWINLF